jgi:hypothetical protein
MATYPRGPLAEDKGLALVDEQGAGHDRRIVGDRVPLA